MTQDLREVTAGLRDRVAAGVVRRIITDLCVLDLTPKGLHLAELAPEVTLDEVRAKIESRFRA